jgi:hypothetical protein
MLKLISWFSGLLHCMVWQFYPNFGEHCCPHPEPKVNDLKNYMTLLLRKIPWYILDRS